MQIVAGNLEKIFDNKTIILILEIYCVLKDIKISKDKELEVGKSELTETVKTYLNEINSTPSLLPAEESVLVLKMMGGDGSARKTLVESHLNLVVSVANKYVGRGLPFWDLIQEGNLGLLVAVDKYNANDVFDFSTYSTFWIRSLIIKALTDKVRNIRIPAHIYEKIDLYKKTIINLEMVLNREPLKYEVAGEMGLSVSEVSTLHQLQFDALSANSASFEEEEFENSFSILEESAEDIVIANDRSFQLKELLKECELSRREKIILGLRYGFGRRKPMTLDEIGKEFGITREAVRQTERSLLKKIRATEYMKSYTAYMFNMNELSKSKQVEQIDEEKVPEMTIVEEMQKKDYKNMLKVLKSPSFTKIMSMCSVKNVMIVFLTSGYLDGKCFSPSAIATFFGIEEQEVVDIIKKVLPTYKEIIDKIMNDVDEELELNSYYMKLRRNK